MPLKSMSIFARSLFSKDILNSSDVTKIFADLDDKLQAHRERVTLRHSSDEKLLLRNHSYYENIYYYISLESSRC